jgi:hypothetical protein
MKFKKLLVLSSAFIFTFGAAACSNSSSTPASQQTSEEAAVSAITNAADYVWQLYREKNETALATGFDVVTTVAIGDYDVKVEWELNKTKGTEGIVSLIDKDANTKTLKVDGYYDGKVLEQVVATLNPTFTLNGITKKMSEVTNHSGISFTVEKLVLGTYADWQNLATDTKTQINIKGVVTAVNTSDGSIVFENEEHGYFGYKATNGKKAKVGDTIIFTGTRKDYNGQEEFASGGSYAVVSSGTTVTPTDATADFKAAEKNSIDDTTLGSKYQNKYITLKNCKPTKVDTTNGYYYFTVDGGTTEYYVFSKTSYLSDYSTFIDNYSLAKAAGRTFDYTGITTIYSKGYTFYGIANNPEVISINGDSINDETYVDVISNNISALFDKDSEGNLSKSYDATTTIDFGDYKIGDSTITVTLKSGTTATVDGTKVTLTPVSTADVINTIEVTVKKGEKTKTISISLTTEQYYEKWTSAELTYESFKDLPTNAGNVDCTIACTKDKDSSVNATVSFVSSYAKTTYKEWIIDKGGSMTITAPTGYKIKKVTAEVYISVSATVTDGTNAITGVKDGTGANNGPVYTWEVNGSTIKFDVPSSSKYTQAFYNITIVLVADPTVTL